MKTIEAMKTHKAMKNQKTMKTLDAMKTFKAIYTLKSLKFLTCYISGTPSPREAIASNKDKLNQICFVNKVCVFDLVHLEDDIGGIKTQCPYPIYNRVKDSCIHGYGFRAPNYGINRHLALSLWLLTFSHNTVM